MKKILTLILVLAMLSLTACHYEPTETETFTAQNATLASAEISVQTEGSLSQTENTQETVAAQDFLFAKTNDVPKHLQNQIVGIQNVARYIELPSRILLTAALRKDYPVGDEYWGASSDYIAYYDKTDGKVYINCSDPFCEHRPCAAVGFVSVGSSQFLIGERFYEIDVMGKIGSYALDGTDRRLEFDAGYTDWEKPTPPWGRNRLAYDRYLYIDTLMENDEYHTLRYDTETKTIEDMTEKTGNYILPLYTYNGEIYGRNADGLAIKTDLSLSYTEGTREVYETGSYHFSLDSRMIGIARGENAETGKQSELLGIQVYDMETGEYTLISNELIGHTVSRVVWADENYYYFYAKEPFYIGEDFQENDVYNYMGGKIYRVKHDGTDCVCIYENPNLQMTDVYIYENTIFVSACRIDVHAGIAQTWDWSTYIGTIDEKGMIGALEWAEVIS